MAEDKSPKKKTCFIAMPISTPEHLIKDYGDDPNHFRHVLDALFIPAVKAAGMVPIPPISQGSEVIHSDIIGHLQSADLVLADMSSLNANAFMELGIRTALNKPVCLVRDDRTAKIPFDAALINAETYDCRLLGWDIEAERAKLTAHIEASFHRSGGQNALWKHFGFRLTGSPASAPANTDEKIDVIMNELTALRSAVVEKAETRPRGYVPGAPDFVEIPLDRQHRRQEIIKTIAGAAGVVIRGITFGETSPGRPSTIIQVDPADDSTLKVFKSTLTRLLPEVPIAIVHGKISD